LLDYNFQSFDNMGSAVTTKGMRDDEDLAIIHLAAIKKLGNVSGCNQRTFVQGTIVVSYSVADLSVMACK
jgi:hypothetical protein